MNTRVLQTVLRHAAALADGSTATDAAVLRTFAATRDPAAFAELVRRYGRLVWAVCRHLRPTDADAEDAFQATFLVLLRSADKVRTNALGPWLHTVAHRVACKAGRADGRRRRREQTAAAPDRDAAVPPSAWDALAAAVHDEVAQLPEHLRVPFVLCCLEGRGTTEAAKHLGWKLGTLSGRLTRAKQTLLDRLAKRGLPASAVAVTLTAAAVPAAVAAKVVDLIHTGDAIPATVLELAKGATTMKTMKLLAAAVMVAAGLAASVGGWLSTADAQTPDVSDQARKETIIDTIAGQLAGYNPAAKWEYFYREMSVDANGKPSGLKATDFEQLLYTMEVQGWEYLGQADIVVRQGAALPTHVFRRAKLVKVGGDPGVPPVQQLQPTRDVTPRTTHRPAAPSRDFEVVDVRETVLRRMRQNSAETFADALATKLAATPERTKAVDQYGRTVLEAEVLTSLLQEARQKATDASHRSGVRTPPGDGANVLSRPADPTSPAAVARREAEAAERAREESRKRQAQAADEAAAVLKDIQDVRAQSDRKTVAFMAADFGLTVGQLHGVILRAVERKYPADQPITVTAAPEKGLVDAAGPGPALSWLVQVMDGVKPKPTK